MIAWVLAGGLALVVAALLVKIALLRKSALEIAEALADRLSTDTNALIGISSRDRCMRRLATAINAQLRLLRSQRWRYQNGDRELKEAVTSISHDLRTPLTALCGYLDLLAKEEQTEAARRYLSIIAGRAEAMKALTGELFRYSVILSAEDGLATEPLNVGSVLEESIADNYALLCERGIAPEVRMPEAEVIRALNRDALARIFGNLISNAARYSDGDLSIQLSEEGEIAFSNAAAGLDEVQVGRLFDRFYTVENARQSTGLGLSIARELTAQMGGTISAEYCRPVLTIRLHFP